MCESFILPSIFIIDNVYAVYIFYCCAVLYTRFQKREGWKRSGVNMKRIYDKHWHNIPFSSFSKLSYFKLPDVQFYERFYDFFFSKYSSYENLSLAWKKKKELQGGNIINALQKIPRYSNVLSVGCGIGYLEYKMLPLFCEHKLNLWCYETSDVQFQFLKKCIDSQFLLSGYIQKALRRMLNLILYIYACYRL